MDIEEQLRRREESLRTAWDILQHLRAVIEASRGEPLPRPSRKCLEEEGEILREGLARELFTLHERLNLSTDTASDLWEQHMGRAGKTLTLRHLQRIKEFSRIPNGRLRLLMWIAHGFKPTLERLH